MTCPQRTPTITYRKRPKASFALLRRGNRMCAQRARWNGSQICWIFGTIHQRRSEHSERTSQILLLSGVRVANSARLPFCARGKIRQASPPFGKLRCAVVFKLMLKPVASENKSAFSAVLLLVRAYSSFIVTAKSSPSPQSMLIGPVILRPGESDSDGSF